MCVIEQMTEGIVIITITALFYAKITTLKFFWMKTVEIVKITPPQGLKESLAACE